MLWIALLSKTMGKQLESRAIYPHPAARYRMFESVITLLNYMKDVADELEDKRVAKASSYDWKKHIRISWSAEEQTCKVDIGSFSVSQKNEYLGATRRLCVLYPVSEKLFVNISSSLREKSGVVARCHSAFDVGGEVFQEFACLCSMPLQKLVCHEHVTLRQALQYVNAAALAGVWLLFESLEHLPILTLVTLSKEIQMVQQQFIIADLVPSQDEENAAEESKGEDGQNVAIIEHSHSSLQIKRKPHHNPGIAAPKEEQKDSPAPTAAEAKAGTSESAAYQSKPQEQKPRLPTKTCFGIFATVLNDALARLPAGEATLEGLKGAFRVSSVVRVSMDAFLPFQLKAKRFRGYKTLASSVLSFYDLMQTAAARSPPDFRTLQTIVDVAERLRDSMCQLDKAKPEEDNKRICDVEDLSDLDSLFSPGPSNSASRLQSERTAVSEALYMYERGKIPDSVGGEEWELALLKMIKDARLENVDPQAARDRLEKLRGIKTGNKGKYALAVLAKESAEGLKLVANERVTGKVVELYQLSLTRPHICLSGPTGCGKSSLISVFCSFLYRLQGQIVRKHILSLSVESSGALYGDTRKEDCILRGIEQDLKEQPGCIPCVVCDSEIDSIWLELFSGPALAKYQSLALPESTLNFPAKTLFLYETLSLSGVSPRAASQVAIVNVDSEMVQPHSILSAGLAALYEENVELFVNAFVERDNFAAILAPLFDPILVWIKGVERLR